MDKNKLKVGDVIRFHDWGVGGFLFGIIIEHKDELYHSKLNIWRPKDIYFLQAHEIDHIDVIQSIEEIRESELHYFYDIIEVARNNNIFMNMNICL